MDEPGVVCVVTLKFFERGNYHHLHIRLHFAMTDYLLKETLPQQECVWIEGGNVVHKVQRALHQLGQGTKKEGNTHRCSFF